MGLAHDQVGRSFSTLHDSCGDKAHFTQERRVARVPNAYPAERAARQTIRAAPRTRSYICRRARASPLAHLNQILQPNRIAVILQLFESLSSPNMSIQSICYVIFREN